MEKYQTIFPRFIALLIDLLLVVPIGLIDEAMKGLNLLPIINYIWLIISAFAFSLYFIITQGLYGKTLGKKIMKVKVVDISENPITFYHSFLRELPNLLFNFSSLFVITSPNLMNTDQNFNFSLNSLGNIIFFLMIAWGLADLGTALINNKSRAIHDYIAGTVVIKTDL